MAGETLRTVNEMLANWPDNTAGLISALDGRDMIVSEAVNVGYVQLDNGPVTVPIVGPGDYTQINSLITPVAAGGNFWAVDGNQALVESYTSQGITVPASVIRLTTFSTGMLVSKPGGGTNTYEFRLYQGGVPASGGGFIKVLSSTPEYVDISGSRLVQVSLGEAFDVRVSCLDGTADLQLDEFLFGAQGVPL